MPFLNEMLDRPAPTLKVVDIGAMDVGAPPYAPLLQLPGTRVVGFEPNPEECARLNAKANPLHTFEPCFVGDGRKRPFHWCEWAATSSLYPPNRPVLERFSELTDLVKVKETVEVQTTRLDDIPGCRGADFVNIDVQGATLDVLRGGPETISRALVVHCEVEFVPLYEGEPLFGEVDAEMRRLGFLLHEFSTLARGTFAPLMLSPGSAPQGQILWTDAIYVRSFLNLKALEPDELLKLAIMVERLYGSRDLSLLALQHYDEKTGDVLWDRYSSAMTGRVIKRPPLY